MRIGLGGEKPRVFGAAMVWNEIEHQAQLVSGQLEAGLSSAAAERERTAPMTFVIPTTR